MISEKSKTLLTAAVCIGFVWSGNVQAETAWNEILLKGEKHLGNTWCGLMEGNLHIGTRRYIVFGYQIVLPGTEELVVQIVPENLPLSEVSEHSRLLRIIHRGNQWSLQDTGRDVRSIIPSPELRQALRWGMGYALPSFNDGTIDIGAGEEPSTIQVQTRNSIAFLPGLEGKFRLIIDGKTGKPLRFHAFGLREWQGREIRDYKLGMTFRIVPGCNPARLSP